MIKSTDLGLEIEYLRQAIVGIKNRLRRSENTGSDILTSFFVTIPAATASVVVANSVITSGSGITAQLMTDDLAVTSVVPVAGNAQVTLRPNVEANAPVQVYVVVFR